MKAYILVLPISCFVVKGYITFAQFCDDKHQNTYTNMYLIISIVQKAEVEQTGTEVTIWPRVQRLFSFIQLGVKCNSPGLRTNRFPNINTTKQTRETTDFFNDVTSTNPRLYVSTALASFSFIMVFTHPIIKHCA